MREACAQSSSRGRSATPASACCCACCAARSSSTAAEEGIPACRSYRRIVPRSCGQGWTAAGDAHQPACARCLPASQLGVACCHSGRQPPCTQPQPPPARLQQQRRQPSLVGGPLVEGGRVDGLAHLGRGRRVWAGEAQGQHLQGHSLSDHSWCDRRRLAVHNAGAGRGGGSLAGHDALAHLRPAAAASTRPRTCSWLAVCTARRVS